MNKFNDFLSPEAKLKLDEAKRREAKEKRELRKLSNEEFADRLDYYMSNSFGLRRIAMEYRGIPTYDSVIWFIILPEAIRRLREIESG